MNRLFRTLRGPLPPRAPRFTAKYILGLSVLLYLGWCFLTGQPALSNPLPAYDDGPYHVGAVDVEVPAAAPRNFSDAILRETGEPAFRLDTVLFTVFYPSALKNASSSSSSRVVPSRGRHLWVPRPIGLHAEGYARFASISNFVTNKLFAGGLWALVGGTEIPAHVDAPLQGTEQARPAPSSEADKSQHHFDGDGEQQHDDGGLEAKFPVIVFSHGMASMRTSYSHYLASLASRGYVVAAVEHRDGSGPGSIVLGPDGSEKRVFHAPRESIDPVPGVEELKRLQLGLRQAEVEETVAVLRRIDDGHGAAVHVDNLRGEGLTLAGWRGRLDMEQVVVGGHSYGATLAMQALRGAPSAARPFRGGIVLDPGKASGPLNGDIDVPVLVVHSQSWSRTHSLFYGRPHFDAVRDIARDVLARGRPAWFLTARGTAHTSVTDAPLIEPALLSWTTGSTVDAHEGVMQYVAVSDEFVRFLRDGRRDGVLGLGVTHPAYDRGEVAPPAKGAGMHWQVHVAPESEMEP